MGGCATDTWSDGCWTLLPGHGWNSCRCLAFSVAFLVLQLFDPLAHGESQMGKQSYSFPSWFFLNPFSTWRQSYRARRIRQEQEVSLVPGEEWVCSNEALILLPAMTHLSPSPWAGWELTFQQSMLWIWPEGYRIVFPRRGITALIFMHSNPKSSQLEIKFMHGLWTSFLRYFCFLH